MPIRTNNITSYETNHTGNNKNSNTTFQSNPLPNDTVEISTKKKELKSRTKIGIGIGIVSIIGLGIELICGKGKHLKSMWEKICGKGVTANPPANDSKKYLDKIDDIKDIFSEIFEKNYTKDEANQLAQKYKEIFEEEDTTKFMGKLFEQLKKDYELPDIKYCVEKLSNDLSYAEWSLSNGVKYNINLLSYTVENGICEFTKVDRMHIAKALAHEMKHAAQDKLACQVDIQKNILAYIEREERYNSEFWQKQLRKYGNNVEETKRQLCEELKNRMIPSYKTLEPLSENSPLYQKGLEYIEGQRNYIKPEDGLERYRAQLIEKEAHSAGDRMELIYKLLTNK